MSGLDFEDMGSVEKYPAAHRLGLKERSTSIHEATASSCAGQGPLATDPTESGGFGGQPEERAACKKRVKDHPRWPDRPTFGAPYASLWVEGTNISSPPELSTEGDSCFRKGSQGGGAVEG